MCFHPLPHVLLLKRDRDGDGIEGADGLPSVSFSAAGLQSRKAVRFPRLQMQRDPRSSSADWGGMRGRRERGAEGRSVGGGGLAGRDGEMKARPFSAAGVRGARGRATVSGMGLEGRKKERGEQVQHLVSDSWLNRIMLSCDELKSSQRTPGGQELRKFVETQEALFTEEFRIRGLLSRVVSALQTGCMRVPVSWSHERERRYSDRLRGLLLSKLGSRSTREVLSVLLPSSLLQGHSTEASTFCENAQTALSSGRVRMDPSRVFIQYNLRQKKQKAVGERNPDSDSMCLLERGRVIAPLCPFNCQKSSPSSPTGDGRGDPLGGQFRFSRDEQRLRVAKRLFQQQQPLQLTNPSPLSKESFPEEADSSFDFEGWGFEDGQMKPRGDGKGRKETGERDGLSRLIISGVPDFGGPRGSPPPPQPPEHEALLAVCREMKSAVCLENYSSSSTVPSHQHLETEAYERTDFLNNSAMRSEWEGDLFLYSETSPSVFGLGCLLQFQKLFPNVRLRVAWPGSNAS